ncbi:MAG: c-type cytochrome biogenesis protein CcsB [Deltaproteobacteria bacterium]|nr:c-type cytochrome biogenesis protein CcsB [Deltaproteobacteria bacterium]MBW2086526.1 c-type cytochrome biogenesis protein CcsB [Deltaproteobacteria bacterium]
MTFESSLLLSIITFVYLAAGLAYICLLIFKTEVFGSLGTVITLTALAAHTGAIIWRWVESYQLGVGHAPLSNLYESLIFFAWAITFLYVVMERIYKNRIIGAFVMPLAFLSMAYAGLQPKEIQPLVPALKSNWLIAHVITCFLGYAGFAVSAGLALMFLFPREKAFLRNLVNRLPLPSVLDDLIYQNIAFGFILLTAGIITGAIWAQSAWGAYWSWDPKETWSLITWLIYAAVLHARMVRGWMGKRMAVLSLIGFLSVLFTYLGVNLILSGLHSYAT